MSGIAPQASGHSGRPLGSPGRIVGMALFLGWGFELLFYGQLPGVSVLLFVLALLAVLFWIGRAEGVRPALRNLWLVLPLIFFAAMISVRANGFLTSLNICAVTVLLGLVVYFYSEGRPLRIGLLGYMAAFALAGVNSLVYAAPLLRQTAGREVIRQAGGRRLLPVLRGLLLALPVFMVFTCLLASADLVFARYVFALFQLDMLLGLQELLWRTTLVLVVTWVVAGALAYAVGRCPAPNSREPWESTHAGRAVISLGSVEISTLLVCVNALFLVFGWIQFTYLFGGHENISFEGYTYADYARRGFFELVTVSVLTLALILGLNLVGWRESAGERNLFNGLSSLMVALVLVLLASAFWRMWLYEAAYGYTHLRLYVHVFEVWLALTLVWLVVTLWLPGARFGIGAFVGILGFLATLNVANPDALIAEQNLSRWEVTHTIDTGYLAELSEDAVPSLLTYLDRLGEMDHSQLKTSLDQRLSNMETNAGWREWPSFNLSRWRAYDLLRRNTVSDNLLQPPVMVEHSTSSTGT